MVSASRPRIIVLRAPGTNCDLETAYAFQKAGGLPEILHINRVTESPATLLQAQIFCIPGGFSYGDDLAAGQVLAVRLQKYIGDVLREFHQRGGLILGICNGFQALLKSGLLLAPDSRGPVATLTWNDSHRFEDRWVTLAAQPGKCVFLAGIETMELPVAHAEGKFVPRDVQVLEQLQNSGQLVLRYTARRGEKVVQYPANPNGSIADVAGVCDPTGRIFGLMPHPERHIDPTQHPQWTRQEKLPEVGHGMAVFQNAVRYFQ
ncbi:MAG: phosphoribosylformylglycinamidine synthase [Pirellulaceae bacterium]|nr:MAG: phosphoribosylformylglycinamidine synthase [Pirellulaceae bacterium]